MMMMCNLQQIVASQASYCIIARRLHIPGNRIEFSCDAKSQI